MGIDLLILVGVLTLLVAGIAFALMRTMAFTLPVFPAEPVDLPEVDAEAVAAKLTEAIQSETVSVMGEAKEAPGAYDAFDELHTKLEQMFPAVHEILTRTKVNNYSLLYEWKGTNPNLKPVLYMAHQDVVPVDEASLDEWDHPPFSGAVADGYLYGRGSLDIKCMVITVLESAERLIAEGFQPKRTLYLAFGHDEEIGGMDGAREIVRHLDAKGVKLAAVLDEGGMISPDAFGPTMMAAIGTAEKGIMTLKLTVKGNPGHSAMPPKETAMGVLAKALHHLETNPMPAQPGALTPQMRGMGKSLSFWKRFAFANLWLTGGMMAREIAKDPIQNASIRTTTAITVVNAGMKENVIPGEAVAKVNFRILPGETIESVTEAARRIIGDDRVKLEQISEFSVDPSKISPETGEAFLSLSDALRDVFGTMPVSPYTLIGGTDARHYTTLSENVFRMIPASLPKAEFARVHGINERISLENLGLMTQFFMQIMRKWDDSPL